MIEGGYSILVSTKSKKSTSRIIIHVFAMAPARRSKLGVLVPAWWRTLTKVTASKLLGGMGRPCRTRLSPSPSKKWIVSGDASISAHWYQGMEQNEVCGRTLVFLTGDSDDGERVERVGASLGGA